MFHRWFAFLALALLALLAVSGPDVLAAKPPKPPPTPVPPLSNPALVYSAGNMLYLMTFDGKSTQQLTSGATADKMPIWRADGSEIAFLRDTADGGQCRLYGIKPDGTGLTLLHDFCAVGGPRPDANYLIDWSPDGTQLAYASNLGTYQPHLYVLDIAAGTVEDLTPGDDPAAMDPSWSPDGTKIAYHGSPDPFNPRGVLVLDLDTGTTVNVTPGEEAHLPSWSNDGTRIAYFSGSTLMTMQADGSDKTGVVTVRDQARATWSPNDDYLAFHNRVTVKRKTTNDLLRVRPDGTGMTNLTNTTAVWESWPDWNPAWDPNG